MKPVFINTLQCVACSHHELEPEIHKYLEENWRSGNLTCTNCGFQYLIRNGVIDTIPDIDPGMQGEYDAFIRTYEESPVSTLSGSEKKTFLLELPDSAGDKYTGITFRETLAGMGTLSGKRILDLGAGLAWTSREFSKQGALVTALELIDHQLFAAETYFHARDIYFERVRGDMERLPFNEQSFDVVFSRASVHHSHNLLRVFTEINRVLVPGGRFFLSQEPVFGVFQQAAIKKFGTEGRSLGSNENCFTTLEWQSSMKIADLEHRFVFLSDGLKEKFVQYRTHHMYKHRFWDLFLQLADIPPLLKLLKICYISPLHYLYPVNMLITGSKKL